MNFTLLSDHSDQPPQPITDQQQQTIMYNQTTRPLYVLFVFGTLALLSLAALVAFFRVQIQRRRRIMDSTPKPRYRRHHRLWILAAGAARRPPPAAQLGTELQTITSSRSADSANNEVLLPTTVDNRPLV